MNGHLTWRQSQFYNLAFDFGTILATRTRPIFYWSIFFHPAQILNRLHAWLSNKMISPITWSRPILNARLCFGSHTMRPSTYHECDLFPYSNSMSSFGCEPTSVISKANFYWWERKIVSTAFFFFILIIRLSLTKDVFNGV